MVVGSWSEERSNVDRTRVCRATVPAATSASNVDGNASMPYDCASHNAYTQ